MLVQLDENGISGNKYWKVETKIITYKESVFPGKNQEDQVKNLNIEFSDQFKNECKNQ